MLKAARPISELAAHYPDAGAAVQSIAAKAGVDAARLRFLPLMSRRESWVVLLDEPQANIVGYLPLDGFF
jgi:hypothetical protein